MALLQIITTITAIAAASAVAGSIPSKAKAGVCRFTVELIRFTRPNGWASAEAPCIELSVNELGSVVVTTAAIGVAVGMVAPVFTTVILVAIVCCGSWDLLARVLVARVLLVRAFRR